MERRQRLETITSFALVCFVAGLLTLGSGLFVNQFVFESSSPASASEPGVQIPAPEPTPATQATQNPGNNDDEDEDEDAEAEDEVEDVGPIMPRTLNIPRLSIDADVEHVGYTEDGRMDEPADWENVAWFQYGFFPGAPGNAVLAGHVDSDVGAAVFSGLYLMEIGDEIYVEGEDGELLTFVVTDIERVEAEHAPLDRIFGPSDTPQLNLITCEGHFDEDEEDYDHRLIVYTTLVDA